jgi:L-Lysine epsilon oxidase N-terminal/L-lysine epsilon oxidase C-terminal domain
MIDPNLIRELRVYPPIGIARVGNAPQNGDYLIGPETIGGAPTLPGTSPEHPARHLSDFRTETGEIKRQAARFRVYAHMQDGSVCEVTADHATIEWRVAVANLKAGWYEFNQAMDLGTLSHDAKRRNIGAYRPRERLDIVPSPRTIAGRNTEPIKMEDGTFYGKPVYVGELRTDDVGRLLVIGGMGKAAPFRKGMIPLTFANNDGWHDDLCDGPVRANVTFPGRHSMAAEPGYVTVTPPNYAPGLFGVVTMDDVVREVFVDQGWLELPTATSFADDVLPIFRRLSGLQWVNHGLFVLHGFGSPLDADDPEVVDRLNDASPANLIWRKSVFDLFRDPNAPDVEHAFTEDRIPQVYGDGVDTIFDGPDGPNFASGELSVSKLQYTHLARWAAGDFTPAATTGGVAPPEFSALAPASQVEHLERAALHDCLGGPFHPAMEMTWVLRIPHLWSAPYRLKILPGDEPAKQDFGDVLTPRVCIGTDGPYDGADYFPEIFLSMPTFWGPRAPDQVLAEGNYLRAAALSADGKIVERQMLKHLMYRVDWLRDIRGKDYLNRLSNMITEWSELGMVLPVDDAPTSLSMPAMRVEQGRVAKGKIRQVTETAKFRLTQRIEKLNARPPAVAASAERATAAAAAPMTSQEESKRSYRPGTI